MEVSQVFKRLVSFLAVGLIVLGPALPVYAGGLVLETRDLYFRNLGCPTCVGTAPADSAVATRGVSVATTEPADTTANFSPLEWSLPGPYANPTTVSDTVSWLRVVLAAEGTSPTVSGDTVGVILQVSDDEGTTWTTTTWTGPKIDLDVSNSTQAAVLETGSSNTFAFTIRQTTGGVTLGGPFFSLNTAPTANQLFGYRLARFIFTGDHTGKFRCKLIGFKNEQGDN